MVGRAAVALLLLSNGRLTLLYEVVDEVVDDALLRILGRRSSLIDCCCSGRRSSLIDCCCCSRTHTSAIRYRVLNLDC